MLAEILIVKCLGLNTRHKAKILEKFQGYANEDTTLNAALDVVSDAVATENKFSTLEELHHNAKDSRGENFLEE